MSETTRQIQDGTFVLTMSSGKVNAITIELIRELRGEVEAATALAAAGEIRAVVLRSDRERFFSPGFHLQKLMGLGPEGMLEFATLYADLCIKLLAVPVYTVAAIAGHTIAGGLILALCCDERYAADDPDSKIGLNEVRIGLPLPAAAVALVQHRLTPASAFEAVMLAETYAPRAAERIGLIDRVVPPSELDEAVARRLAAMGEVAGKAFRLTKASVQKSLLEAFALAQDDLPRDFERILGDAELQQQIMESMIRRQKS